MSKKLELEVFGGGHSGVTNPAPSEDFSNPIIIMDSISSEYTIRKRVLKRYV